MRWLHSLALIASFTGTVHAGWKITTQTSSESYRSVVTEYFDGGLKRTDYLDQKGRRYVTVVDLDHARQTTWRPDLREYTVVRLNREFASLPLSPQITVVDQVTTDTGERRTLFGHTTRHLVTHETSHVEGSPQSEKQTDAWYLDADTLPREKRGGSAYVLAFSGANTRPNIQVNHAGPAMTGLAVRQKVTITSSGYTHEWTMEVTELVEGPLGKDVFEPPGGFRRVTSFTEDRPLSWIERIQRQCEWFEDLFTGVGD